MFLTGLARVARDAGITVREVPGWKTRTAHKGGMNKVHGVVWHHTATPASAVTKRNNPTLNYMVNGLGYPLANYGLAWDGSLDVIAAGTGAHAGKGSYKGIPNDDGNRHLIGVEVEGTIGLTWSDAQLETAARLGAQLDKDFGTSLLHIAHYEWAPGRKTDPTGIPGRMPALRAAIKRGYWKQDATSRPSPVTPKPDTPAPAPIPKEWSDMASKEEFEKIAYEQAYRAFVDVLKNEKIFKHKDSSTGEDKLFQATEITKWNSLHWNNEIARDAQKES